MMLWVEVVSIAVNKYSEADPEEADYFAEVF